MYLGRLVETGPGARGHPPPAPSYTQGLLAALPKLDDLDAPLIPVPGDIPSRWSARRAASSTPAAQDHR